MGGDPGKDPRHAGGITSPGWSVNASGSPRMSWKMLRARGKSGSGSAWVERVNSRVLGDANNRIAFGVNAPEQWSHRTQTAGS